MDNKKYDIWTYYTYNKPTDELRYVKISCIVSIILGVLLLMIFIRWEHSPITANLIVLGILLILFGMFFYPDLICKKTKSNSEIIYAYVYCHDTENSKDMLYVLDMWSEEFLELTGLHAYGRRISIINNNSSKVEEINNEKRRKIVDTVRRYNIIQKLIDAGRFEDIAMPIWRVTGIKETRHSVKVYYSYFLKQKQIDTFFGVRDNIENFDTLAKCLREYVHKKTTCCSWCGCIKIEGKCVVCGDTNGIKIPSKMPYYVKSACLFIVGIIGILLNKYAECSDTFACAIVVFLSMYAFSYGIVNLAEMKKHVR